MWQGSSAWRCRVVLQWPKVHPHQVRRQAGQLSLVQGWLESLAPAIFCTLTPRIAVQEPHCYSSAPIDHTVLADSISCQAADNPKPRECSCDMTGSCTL